MIDTIAFFKNIGPTIRAMTDEDAGIVIKALFAHSAGDEGDISGASDMVKALYPLLEESTDRLNAIREARSKAGKTKGTNDEQKGNKTETNEEQKAVKDVTHNHSHNHSHSHIQDHNHPSSDEEGKERELKLPKEAALPPELDQDIVKEAFKDFRTMRTKIKKPMTQRAEELIIKELLQLSNGDPTLAEKILNQSIMNSWQGVFPLKEKPEDARKFPGLSVLKDDRDIDYDAAARDAFLKEVCGL